MTGKERIQNILERKAVDRIGIAEHFWSDTYTSYLNCGYIKENESLENHFGLDLQECWAFNVIADLDFKNEIISEDLDTITIKNGNGATLRQHKKHDSTPEHVKYEVTCREEWEKYKLKLTNIDERRINFEWYRAVKANAKASGRFFVWSGINVFECMHPICGHENLLAGMALDPEWIQDMAKTYSHLTIELQKILFKKEGLPDGIWYYEDMGFKESPFMSPTMYEELIMPYHKNTIEYAHSIGLKVIMHSCGFVEPLLDGMIKAGIDCLQALEVKAGMNLIRIYEKYGKKIVLMGGIDVRVLYSNDKKLIDEELEKKIPIVKNGFGYILHSDHSIPKTVEYEIYKYFLQKAIEIGTY